MRRVNEKSQIRPDDPSDNSIYTSVAGETDWREASEVGIATESYVASAEERLNANIDNVNNLSIARDQVLSSQIEQMSIPAGYTETAMVKTFEDDTVSYAQILVKEVEI